MWEASDSLELITECERLDPQVYVGLRLLLAAYDKTEALQCGVWEHPVQIRALRAAGIENGVLRRLVDEGLARMGTEPANGEEQRPTSRGLRQALHCDRACFVLTNSGVHVARRGCPGPASDGVPRWDGESRELRLDDWVVKRFRRPAPDQEAILAALEEQGWTRNLDDPLPPQDGQVAKQRFHDAIKRLNKGQKPWLIRFMGNGLGTGLRWELV